MSPKSLFTYVTDPYERKARLVPGLLVIFPAAFLVVSLLGPTQLILGSLLTLLTSCGVLYVLARISRTLGKRVEERLVKNWGGLPSTILMRHRDSRINRVTKRQYHTELARLSGVKLPSAEEEQRNPEEADEAYRAVGVQLLRLTRAGDFPLLKQENTNYGFHRNAQGLRLLGVACCALVLLYIGFAVGLLSVAAPHVRPIEMGNVGYAYAFTAAIAAVFLIMWVLYFNDRSTQEAGFAYAERLLEAGMSLADTAPKRTASRKAEKPLVEASGNAEPR